MDRGVCRSFFNPFPFHHHQRQLGRAVARIHDTEVVHGDLTTSNFLVVESGALSSEGQGHKLVGG